MSDGYVSLAEAREAARREVLAHVERVLRENSARELGGDESEPTLAPNSAARGWGTIEGEKCRSLDFAEKRGSARDDGAVSRDAGAIGRDDGAVSRDDRDGDAKRVKSIVIDVPFEAVRTAEQVRAEQVRTIRHGEAVGDVSLMRCQRRMADGRVCGLPAHDGADQCARHYKWYSLVPNYYGLPYPENATAVQEILARVAALVLRKQIEPRVGETVARLCREMSRNLAAYHRETEALRRECVATGGLKRVQ